jgi:predicted N-acetyltransferase YhbS
MRKRLAVCFVLADEAMQVMAYYALSAQSLGSSAVPVKFRDQLPANYDAPVILLGRLACDLQEQGKGLGSWLLLDALFRSWELSNHSIGAMAVVTDPLDEKATAFYHRYGFYHLEQSARMFLPMKAIQRLFA